MAKRHVLEGRRIVARQRRLVEQQQQAGIDTIQSERLLGTFERTLAIFEADLAQIVAGMKPQLRRRDG